MKQIVIFPRGCLTELDRARLDAADIVAVECDDPSKVVYAIPAAETVCPSDMLMAALKAVKEGNEGNRFISDLYRRLIERELKAERQEVG